MKNSKRRVFWCVERNWEDGYKDVVVFPTRQEARGEASYVRKLNAGYSAKVLKLVPANS